MCKMSCVRLTTASYEIVINPMTLLHGTKFKLQNNKLKEIKQAILPWL